MSQPILALAASASPLPVILTTMPGPDAYTVASVKIALVALGVALATLLAVFRQIWIATQELKAVKGDFDLAQRQLREITRRPKVTVGVGIQVPDPSDVSVCRPFFNVSNKGDRLSNAIMLELLVEAKAIARI